MLAEIRLRAEGLRSKMVYVVLSARPAGHDQWGEVGATETDFSDSPDPVFSKPIILPYTADHDKAADVKLELRRHDANQKLLGATGFAMLSMASEPTHRLRLRIIGENNDIGHLIVYGTVCRDPPPAHQRPGPLVAFDVSLPQPSSQAQLAGPSKKRRYFYAVDRLFAKTNEYLPVFVSEIKRPTTPFVPTELSMEAASLYDPNAKLRFRWMLQKAILKATSSSKTSVQLLNADLTISHIFAAPSPSTKTRKIALHPVICEAYKFKVVKCALTISSAAPPGSVDLTAPNNGIASTTLTIYNVSWISQ